MASTTNGQFTQPSHTSIFRRHRARHAAAYFILALSAAMMLGLHSIEDDTAHVGPDFKENRGPVPKQPAALPPLIASPPAPTRSLASTVERTLILIEPGAKAPWSDPAKEDRDDTLIPASNVQPQPSAPAGFPQPTNLGQESEAISPPLHKPHHPLWWRLVMTGAAGLHTLGYLILLAPYLCRRSRSRAKTTLLLPAERPPTAAGDEDEPAIQRMINDGCPNGH